jgi:DNA polymerase-3 subunit epsilon
MQAYAALFLKGIKVIHQLLTLTRPLFVVDTETTGTNPAADRIVELGFQLYTKDGLQKEWQTFVNPGIRMPESAMKVHKITDERLTLCNQCGLPPGEHTVGLPGERLTGHQFKIVPTFKQLAANVAIGFSNCDYAGKRIRFDLQIIDAEMRRAGVGWSYAGARIVDADRLEQLAVPRSLGHLHEKYVGHTHDGAHGALSDVRATATVIAMQLKTHQVLPRDLDTLHAAQWPGMIDVGGKFKFVDGVACFGNWGKYRNQPMRNADVGYWDFILKNDFSLDVKMIVSQAKLGQFPEEIQR